MSSIRGRVIRPGGVAVDPGATPRFEGGPGHQPITRPAYRVAQGVVQPTGVAGIGGADGVHPLLDLSQMPAWRLVFVAAAAAWLGFVWVSLRGGLSGGVRV